MTEMQSTDDNFDLPRWRHCLYLLSLDLSSRFFAKLWVPVASAADFQTGVRECLAPHLGKLSYYDGYGEIVVSLLDWGDRKFGGGFSAKLKWWTDNVFTHNGTDRSDEFLWELLMPGLAAQDAADSVGEFVRRCQIDSMRARTENASAFATLLSLPRSDWDHNLAIAEGALPHRARDHIENICGLNTFVATWCHHLPLLEVGHLRTMVERGKQLAEQFYMAEAFCVPGMWCQKYREFVLL